MPVLASTQVRAAQRAPAACKRRLIGWIFLTTALLFTLIFIVSRWSWFGYVAPSWSFWFSSGELTISVPAWNIFGSTGLQAKSASARISWTWIIDAAPPPPNALTPLASKDVNLSIARYRVFGRGNAFLDILLWPPALAALLTGAALLWSARRARHRAAIGHCPNCNYNLTGLAPGAPCPECGRVTQPRVGSTALALSTPTDSQLQVTADLKHRLNQVPWASLAIANGRTADGVPAALVMLGSTDPQIRQRGYWDLDNNVVLQSQLYEAAYHVVPFLLGFLQDRRNNGRELIYDLLFEIGCGKDTAGFTCRTTSGTIQPLEQACRDSVERGRPMYARDLHDADPVIRHKAQELIEGLDSQAPLPDDSTPKLP